MYYYFCAALPTLDMDEKPVWAVADFIEECRRILANRDFQEVRALLAGNSRVSASTFARRFLAWETQLRNTLARLRAGRLNTDVTDDMREHQGFDVSLEKEVADAFAKPNPLDRELFLDRLRWRRAEDEARSDPFGLPAIMAFAIKLRIAWRWADMTKDKGREFVADFIAESAESALEKHLRM